MSESFILSMVFIGIIALIGFIGANFGIARGFLATASIFAGAELALWWSDGVGRHLSDWFNVSAETGRFLGSIPLLVAPVLLLGAGGSLVLQWGVPTRWGATLGVLLGAANGALLIAMALRFYFLSYAGDFTNTALDDSVVTRVLWHNFDWFLLGFLVVSTVLLLYTRFAQLPVMIPDPSARIALNRPIPPPLLRPVAMVRPMPESAGSQDGASARNGSAPRTPGDVDDAIFAPPRPAEPSTQQGGERTAMAALQTQQAELPSARNVVRFCPNCGMTLDASDRFCPDCGFTL